MNSYGIYSIWLYLATGLHDNYSIGIVSMKFMVTFHGLVVGYTVCIG